MSGRPYAKQASRRHPASLGLLPELDEEQFDSAIAAARAGLPLGSRALFDYLAAWIMDANEVSGTCHMSTGQTGKAFFSALTNARTLAVPEAHPLAAQACRFLASRRIIRDLEDLIAASAGPAASRGSEDSPDDRAPQRWPCVRTGHLRRRGIY